MKELKNDKSIKKIIIIAMSYIIPRDMIWSLCIKTVYYHMNTAYQMTYIDIRKWQKTKNTDAEREKITLPRRSM